MNFENFLNKILFIGITIHELAHITACLLLGVKIKKAKIFGLESGYVVHDQTNAFKGVIIAFFPFFFNILVAIMCAFLINQNYSLFSNIFFIWIGVASLYASVPSVQDSKTAFNAIKRSYSGKGFLKWVINIVFLPITLIVIIVAFLFKNLDQSFIFRLVLIGLWVFLYFL